MGDLSSTADTSHSVRRPFSASPDADRVVTISPLHLAGSSHCAIRKQPSRCSTVPLQMQADLKCERAGKTVCPHDAGLDLASALSHPRSWRSTDSRWGVDTSSTQSASPTLVHRGFSRQRPSGRHVDVKSSSQHRSMRDQLMNRLFANRADRDAPPGAESAARPAPASTEPDPSTGGTPSIQTNVANCIPPPEKPRRTPLAGPR